MRTELADEPDEGCGRDLQRLQGEAAVGQRRERVALGQTRVHEAEPAVLHPEDPHGLGHLLAAVPDDVPLDLRVLLQPRVEDVAALPAGAADDHHPDALGDVPGHGGGTLARLVVRVRVHRHQAQLLAHVLLLLGSSLD